jgi:hypothetical protein
MPTRNTIRELVNAELAGIGDERLVSRIREFLVVEPYAVVRDWDYGHPGEAYECWTVLEHRDSNTAIAFCERGFGPTDPWGLVSLSGPNMNIGMDCSWYANLEDAMRESQAWDGPNPPDYEVQ